MLQSLKLSKEVFGKSLKIFKPPVLRCVFSKNSTGDFSVGSTRGSHLQGDHIYYSLAESLLEKSANMKIL